MKLSKKGYTDKIITGAFRVRCPEQHFSPSGQAYVYCILESNLRSIPAYAQANTYSGIPITKDHQLIWGKFLIQSVNGVKYADLICAESLVLESCHLINLLPYWEQIAQAHIATFREITCNLTTPSLFAFINSALSNQDTLLKYLSSPASINHHHSQPGGLLEHSTEVATIVSRHSEFPRKTLEIAMVAALFHDIGKIRTMTADMRYTPINYLLRHEDLTLEILSEPLKILDNKDPDTALALRYLLSWSPTKGARPKLTVAEALRSADRISSGLNAEIKAFENRPSYHKFATLNCSGPKSQFWRPSSG